MTFRASLLVDPRSPARSLQAWLAVILFLTALPALLTLAGPALADMFGCRLLPAAVACVVRGHDLAALFADMAGAGWLSMVTLPLGAALLLVWLVGVATLVGVPLPGEFPPEPA